VRCDCAAAARVPRVSSARRVLTGLRSPSSSPAAVDVIGNPLGKSGGSFIQQILIFALGSLAASTPYLAVILFAIIGMWLAATRSLDKQFTEFMLEETREAAAERAAKAAKAS
jgi:ATP:ADP antiporter, AAA family